MANTKAGGKKVSETLKSKYGSDHWAKIGAMGGKAKVPKGFALMSKDKVRAAGRKGGQKTKEEYTVR